MLVGSRIIMARTERNKKDKYTKFKMKIIDDKLKKSYEILVQECIDREFMFKQENQDCGLARKVTEIYLIQCPNRCEFKCCGYKKLSR